MVTGGIGVVMLTRLDRRNVILDPLVQPNLFGGRYYEAESDRKVVYRFRRLPAALGISFSGGILSGLLGYSTEKIAALRDKGVIR